jgi:hypothetical protein
MSRCPSDADASAIICEAFIAPAFICCSYINRKTFCPTEEKLKLPHTLTGENCPCVVDALPKILNLADILVLPSCDIV